MIRDVTSRVTCTADVLAVTGCEFVFSQINRYYDTIIKEERLYTQSCFQYLTDPRIDRYRIRVVATFTIPVFERNFTGSYALKFCDILNYTDCQTSENYLIAGMCMKLKVQ